ncbi:Na+-translocating ferredoxin:NAD+ oxidoreductase RnfC subunit [Aequitasia blattaphilus]|uniref:SLBB domain-containing protein n=1 Tax=Aequitasia blattaphilus TaxID=2949332 RepID=A0ABT1EBI1_9FIRM|nr:4Fe-4S dicluster domain-containing protein [Aequitasia blattaphilus]MCP1102201.1 SLBB domain-containing protein [Aequitasia blattaphilus]MCR8614841.1 SLBB domain-containing protein [Aequitasia blattaphilus]
MERQELSDILQQNGIVGAGGAGFPTYGKLDERAETIILNCAECEPLLRLHRQLLEKHAGEIVETFHMIGETLGAKDVVIGIKEAYKETIEALNQVVADYKNVRLGLLEEVYPAGDEVVLIYEVTGKVIRPGVLPIESGIAVFNVETVYNIYRALHNEPVIEKLVSVVAEVENPITVKVPIGTSLEEVVKMAGKTTVNNPVYFVGGPMMGSIGSKFQPVTKTTNGILVLPQDHLLVQKKNSNSSIDLKRAAACCCNCSMCTDLCPRNRLGHPIEPHKFMQAATCKDVQNPDIFVNTYFCSSCGLCEMFSCFQGLSPRTLMTEYKGKLRGRGVPMPKVEAKGVGPEREFRKVPMERLMARLDLTKYDKEAPLKEEVPDTKRVKILMSQHIGAPAIPRVTKGDKVKKGDVVGAMGKGLSVNIHASIDGTICEVNDKYVMIEA